MDCVKLANPRRISPCCTADQRQSRFAALVEKIPVSQIGEQMQVQPTLIHNWVNTAMAQVERAFENPRTAKAEKSKKEDKLSALRDKLNAKNEVIAELMEENIRSKKESGES